MEQFFKEIRAKEKKLTIEDEVDLFKQIATGNTQAKDDIFYSNLRFAIHKAKKYYTYGPKHQDDFIQACSIGLYLAIDTFDYTKGVKFITYARWLIQKEITEYISNGIDIIKLPASLSESISYPSTFSYDALNTDEEVEEFSHKLSFLKQESSFYEESHIDNILSDLKPFQKTIIKEYIFENKSFTEVSDTLKKKHKIKMSREKVRYTYGKLIKKLSKKYSKKEFIHLFI